MNISESIWRKADLNQSRRERTRLIRLGRITFKALPNVLEFTDGRWKFPSLKAS
jgi:hypothetical protein